MRSYLLEDQPIGLLIQRFAKQEELSKITDQKVQNHFLVFQLFLIPITVFIDLHYYKTLTSIIHLILELQQKDYILHHFSLKKEENKYLNIKLVIYHYKSYFDEE